MIEVGEDSGHEMTLHRYRLNMDITRDYHLSPYVLHACKWAVHSPDYDRGERTNFDTGSMIRSELEGAESPMFLPIFSSHFATRRGLTNGPDTTSRSSTLFNQTYE